jgi:hypothetical protein
MITPDGELIYGSLADDDNIHISNKFIAVKKIVRDYYKYYILDSGNVYSNTTIHDDNYVIINHNLGTDIKIIDIENAHGQKVYVVSSDNKLYTIENNFISNINEINCTNCNNIIAVYSSFTNLLIIKNNTCEYYLMYDNGTYKYLGIFDKILFTEFDDILIKGDNIETTHKSVAPDTLQMLMHNMDVLYKVQNGSFIRYYNSSECTNTEIHIRSSPMNARDKIIIMLSLENVISICCATSKVFVCARFCDQAQESPKLKGCVFSKICDTNSRYSHTKNASSIITQ